MYFLRITMFLTVMVFSVLSCAKGSDKAVEKKADKAEQKDMKLSDTEEVQERIKESKKLGKAFAGGLQKELKGAIKTKGVAKAISVCKEASAAYEDEFKTKDSDIISFRRVSLKARNVDAHTPTDKERDWLISADKSIAGGAKPKPGILKEEDKLTVLLPIAIKKDVCLKCHGDSSKFPKDLKDALKKNYPLDKAVGFKMNDLRGALVVEWKRKYEREIGKGNRKGK